MEKLIYIYITFKNFPDDFVKASGSPEGYKTSTKPYQLHYNFKDFTPKEDIHLELEYKYISPEIAIGQINKTFQRGDIKTTILLFRKLYETIKYKKIDIKKKDLIRIAAFKTAGKIFKKNIEAAITLYYIAFYLTHSNKEMGIAFNMLEYIILEFRSEYYNEDFSQWKHEGENNAPCYYITYNLACAYSITKDLELADQWLQISFEMNPELKKMAIKDKDLENYRERYTIK